MKATEQFFPVVLFVVLYKVVLYFESVLLVFAAPPRATKPKRNRQVHRLSKACQKSLVPDNYVLSIS